MKKKLFFKRTISIIITITLLFSAIPMSLAVQNLLAEETTAKIVREVIELREESAKHFLCEDGSYIAATYSAPVHYQENGEWKEIDNSLSLDRTVLSNSGKPTYTTKAGGLSVSIPQDFSDEQKITTRHKGYEIGFGVNANQSDVSVKASASVVELETLSSNTEIAKLNTVKSINNASALDSNDIEVYNAEIITVDNQSSAVTFKEILPDTDFEYIVTTNSIKENIVVYEPQSEYTYIFDMSFDGLTPTVNPDNSISLTEPGNPNEIVFFIETPYMYDSNSEESTEIEMSLVPNGDEYVMTLVASAEWINDTGRVFPVIIDPTIYIPESDLNDVFVMNGVYANSPRINNELRVGRNLTNVTRTYIKPELPVNIPLGSKIDSATLSLYKNSYYQAPSANEISVYVFDCSNVANWEPDMISWNNQPFNNSNNGYQSVNWAGYLSEENVYSSKSDYDFDIRYAVQQWVNGGVNNGLMLVSSDEETKSQIDFASTRSSDSSKHPQLTIQYRTSGTDITEWTTDKEAASCTVHVTSSILDWTVTSDQPWLTVPAKHTSSFEIAVSENTSTQERTGTITVAIGNTVISTISIIQYGTAPTLSIDKQSWNVYGESDKTEVTIISNDNWNIIIDEEDNEWVTASSLEGYGNAVVTIEVSENREAKRETTITFINETSAIIQPFKITQLDVVSGYFCEFDGNGNVTLRDSSQYNHNLAILSMALSYAAYNPIAYQAIPFVPSSFMQEPYNDETKTAEAELESLGFDATSYNYDGGYLGCAAHVIGHRNITIAETTSSIGGNENDYNGNINADVGNSTIHSGVLSGDFSAIDTSSRESVATVLNSTSTEANSNSTRQLVVISVRGSVTPMDWVMDLASQFNSECMNFEIGCQEVIDSLNGYLTANGITNPIVLVTGHSLGAAIANLVAAELNETESVEDVYSYTFATPNTVNLAYVEEITSYTNIFNFLNNNDLVPHFPMDGFASEWIRYGRDFHITMPWATRGIELFDVDMLGVFGHGMPTYYSWITNLTESLDKDAEELTVADLEMFSEDVAVGLFAKLVRAKCPVSVTMHDDNGNIVAYESQGTVSTQGTMTDVGIVSWITENNEKIFLIPYGCEAVDVNIKAYDYGTMNLTVEQPGVGEPLNTKTYNNVSLYPGKEFMVEVSDDVLPEDTQLFITENGEVVGEVTDTNPFFKGVTANPSEVTYDEIVTFTLVTDNTVTAMMLHNLYSGDHVNLVPGEGDFNVVASGENELTWTATFLTEETYVGLNTFDISVRSGGIWYYYENVVAVNVTF